MLCKLLQDGVQFLFVNFFDSEGPVLHPEFCTLLRCWVAATAAMCDTIELHTSLTSPEFYLEMLLFNLAQGQRKFLDFYPKISSNILYVFGAWVNNKENLKLILIFSLSKSKPFCPFWGPKKLF